jgi:transcriptional antiterminator RfaH
MDLAKYWHIALCRRGKEPNAESNLRLRGYQVYRPVLPGTRLNRWRRYSGVEKSMFPGYLFVLPHPSGWEMLRATPWMLRGNRALMTINNRLVKISDDAPEFQLIWQKEEELRRKLSGKPAFPYDIGDRVRIESGPWVQFMGVVETVDSETRITCLIEMLGRKVRADVDAAHVTAIRPQPA